MKTKKILLPLVALFVLGLSSCCDEKEGLTYSSTVLKNSELKTILTSKGFSFDKDGKLELNNLATSTVSLDLSNTKLKDLSGLDILPNLKEVKLYLPASAKYNVEDLMPFNMLQGQETDIKMADSTGKMEKYTTVREIPDPIFCEYLKTLYPSMFIDKNHIDFSKMPKLTEQGQNIFLFALEEKNNPTSIEGIEYFINNPFLAKFMVGVMTGKTYKVGYLMPGSNIDAFSLEKTEIEGGIDFSKANLLGALGLSGSSSIKHLDLSHTKICNQDIKDFHPLLSNSLHIENCPNLEDITFANPSTDCMSKMFLANLPKLKKIDLSKITALTDLTLFLDNTEVIYPKLKNYFSSDENTLTKLSDGTAKVTVSVSQKILDTPAFKTFIKDYGQYCSDGYEGYKNKYKAVAWKNN